MTDYRVGSTVTFRIRENADSASGAYGPYSRHEFNAGDTAEVTRVNKNKITVRIQENRYGALNWSSYNVSRAVLEAPNGEVWGGSAPAADGKPRPVPRKLGTAPEGDHISIDDPRIQWLWTDLATYATQTRYCGEYDAIVTKFGIPGRERSFTANALIGGLAVTASLRARSQKEADEKFAAKLAEAATAKA